MIELSAQLCQELDMTYWQLNNTDNTKKSYQLGFKEKELLEKILLAKNVKLNVDQVAVFKDDIVVVSFDSIQLIFNNVNNQDTKNEVHLAKLSQMLVNQNLKKHTWHKLKNLDL